MNNSDKEQVFSFQCPKQWNELDNTEDEYVRFCSQCNKPVYLAGNTKELAERAIKKQCAAIKQPHEQGHQIGYPDNSILIGEPATEPYPQEIPRTKKQLVLFQLCRKVRSFLGF